MAFQNITLSSGVYGANDFTAGSIPANRDILFFNNSDATMRVTFTSTTDSGAHNWVKVLEPNAGFNYRAAVALSTVVASAEFLHTGIGATDAAQGKDTSGDLIGAAPQARFIAAQLGGTFGA